MIPARREVRANGNVHVKIVNRVQLPRDRLDLISSVNAELGASTDGLFVVLESDSCEGYPRYRVPAFHMSIKIGGVEDRSPPHMLDLMRDPACDNIVWLSRQVCDSNPIRFTWIYAHELQHLVQCASDPILSEVGGFLELNLRRILPEAKFAIDLPAELDAEMCARRVVCKLFGDQACQDYIESERRSPKGADYYDRFARLEPMWGGDLKAETQRFIRQSETAVRREYEADYNLQFGFDLDAFLNS